MFAALRNCALCCPGTHRPFLPVGNQGGEETQLNIKKPVEVRRSSAWFSWPCGTPLGFKKKKKRKRRYFSFLESDLASSTRGWGVLRVRWGMRSGRDSKAGSLQWGYKYPEILLWQGQTYCIACGRWKGKAFLQMLIETWWTLCNLGSHPWLPKGKS